MVNVENCKYFFVKNLKICIHFFVSDENFTGSD